MTLPCSGPSIRPGAEGDDDGGDDGGRGDRPGPSRAPPPSVMKKTPQQIAGEAVLKRVLETVDGLCFSFKSVLNK